MPSAKPTGSQFDSILSSRKPLPAVAASAPEAAPQATPQGKATAKSKDSQFRPSTLYLRKQTLMDCEYRLKHTDDPRDRSELVEDLLQAWLNGSTPAHTRTEN